MTKISREISAEKVILRFSNGYFLEVYVGRNPIVLVDNIYAADINYS